MFTHLDHWDFYFNVRTTQHKSDSTPMLKERADIASLMSIIFFFNRQSPIVNRTFCAKVEKHIFIKLMILETLRELLINIKNADG